MKKISTLILICFTLFAKADYWTQKADFGGAKRYVGSGFVIGNLGYIGGGIDSNGAVYYNDFWSYDPLLNIWTQIASFPGQMRYDAISFAIGNKGYYGWGGSNGNLYTDLWEYDPSLNIWTQKISNSGFQLFTGIAFSILNHGYFGIGFDIPGVTWTRNLWEYDPGTNGITQKAQFPGISRDQAFGFSIDNKGYVGTGRDTNFIELSDFWEYDPVLNTWLQKASFPSDTRYDATGFVISNKGYLGLGYPFINDFWEYSPSTNTWSQIANFSGLARMDAVSFTIGNKGYVGVGVGSPVGDIGSKDFWEYTPDPTGIEELPNTNLEFTISPNPVKEFLLINYPLTGKEKINLTISDVNGKKILHTQPAIINNQSTISLKKFSKGIYFVEVNDEKQKAVKKFLKE